MVACSRVPVPSGGFTQHLYTGSCSIRYIRTTVYGFQSAVAPPLSGSAAAPADGTSSSSAAAAHDYLDDLDVTVAHMERRGALVPPKMDIDDDPGGKRENIS